MNHSIRMAAVAAALVAAAALALPTAAQAEPINYLRSDTVNLVSTLTPTTASGAASEPIAFQTGARRTAAVPQISALRAARVLVEASAGSSPDRSLPATGVDSSLLLGLWVGGGALVLAGGAVAVAAAVRRNRKEHAGV